MFLASIPSPNFNSFDIGPLTIRFYGLAIAAGVLTAVWMARRRYAKAGGDPEFLDRVAIWVVLAGIIGARLGFVLPRVDRFADEPAEAFKVWEGGLTFFGGLLGGALAGLVLVVRNHARLGMLLTAVAPAIPLAQAIGRVGNYFNQELFGRPTDLPWALEIDPAFRRPSGITGYEGYETFHPTFLYEIIWNLALVGLLLWIGARKKLRPGSLALLYLVGYGVGRFLLELIRIDTEARVLGLSRNAYNSIFIVVIGAALFWWREVRNGGPDDTYLDDEDPGSGSDDEASDTDDADGHDEDEDADADGHDEDAETSGDEPEDAEESVTAGAEDDAEASEDVPGADGEDDEATDDEVSEDPEETEPAGESEAPEETKAP